MGSKGSLSQRFSRRQLFEHDLDTIARYEGLNPATAEFVEAKRDAGSILRQYQDYSHILKMFDPSRYSTHGASTIDIFPRTTRYGLMPWTVATLHVPMVGQIVRHIIMSQAHIEVFDHIDDNDEPLLRFHINPSMRVRGDTRDTYFALVNSLLSDLFGIKLNLSSLELARINELHLVKPEHSDAWKRKVTLQSLHDTR